MTPDRLNNFLSPFADLIKPRLTLAVTLSSVTGYFLHRGIADISFVFLVFGVFFLASGSSAMNQYSEMNSDAMMNRTKDRPLPSGKISMNKAFSTACILYISGGSLLAFNGITPFLLGILTIFLYNILYTRLKKLTVFAIIPGALVGAIPPVIGYTSAGGYFLDPGILAFSGFMFLWQLPHFWLIIIKYGKDYNKAGFPNLSKYLNGIQIRYLVFIWVLISTVYLLLYFTFTKTVNGILFILFSILNLIFIAAFYRLLFRDKSSGEIRPAFILINSFSLCLMFFLITLSILKGI
jgi:heme o synthase